jgi:hypothetical protein
MRNKGNTHGMPVVRLVVECLSKALIAVSVMLSLAILAGNPPLETPSRPVAAALLALGIAGLIAVHGSAHPSRR